MAKGLYFALKLSAKYFGCGDKIIKEYENTAAKCGIDVYCDYPLKTLIKIMQSDKKRAGDNIDFILVDKSGKAKIVSIPISGIEGYFL